MNVPPRILVVEDNTVLAEVLRLNLHRAGFEVTVASNGALALKRLQEHGFELLITDFQMPGIDGGELCQRVRQELHMQELPILMCTAKGLEIQVDQLKSELGLSRIVFKPFSMRDIVRSARELTAAQPIVAQI